MTTTFKYVPLNPGRQEIRVVDLAPDATSSHIKLIIRHVTLEEKSRYYALSYTWGAPYKGLSPEWDDPGCIRTINLNGHSFQVRWNLYAALEMLCATPAKFPTMWIDAICIDQSNIQERNSQVSLMGQIYKKAEITFVWLGPGSERFAGVTEMIHTYSQPCDNQFQRFRLMPSHQPVKNLARLLARSWFHRTWVVQEVALSQRVIILLGDGSCLVWEVLESAMVLFEQHFIRLTTLHAKKSTWPLTNSLTQVLHCSFHFQRTRSIRRTLKQESSITLRMVLGILQTFMVTDARDKVYGALGISSSCDFIEVDYNSSVSNVFTATTQGCLKNTGDLMILGLCQPSGVPDFPSWAIDFTAGSTSRPLGSFDILDPSNTLYSAGGSGPAILRFENSKTLIISGFQLGVLAFKGRRTLGIASVKSSISLPCKSHGWENGLDSRLRLALK